MKKIGIIGLGLIGGSMAIDLRRKDYASVILGVENDPVNASAAEKIGLVDRVTTLEECVQESDVVIVSVPVGAALRIVPKVLDIMAVLYPDGGCDKVLMDVCSTKEQLVKSVESHPARAHYVASHPMAGTEYSGPWAAMSGMYDGHACIICDAEKSYPEAVRKVEALYDVLNMRVICMDSSSHDLHTAYVSHISHVTSFALALTVLEKERDEKHIFDLASGGFSSTVRLAKSSAETWIPIFTQNKYNILDVLREYIHQLNLFRKALERDDIAALREIITRANDIRKVLQK